MTRIRARTKGRKRERMVERASVREKQRDRESVAGQGLDARPATERTSNQEEEIRMCTNGRALARRSKTESERVPSVCRTRESSNSSHSIGLERPWIYYGWSARPSEIAACFPRYFHGTSRNAFPSLGRMNQPFSLMNDHLSTMCTVIHVPVSRR